MIIHASGTYKEKRTVRVECIRLYFRENKASNCLPNSFSNIYIFAVSLKIM